MRGNHLELIGNLVGDPVTTLVKGGEVLVTKFSLARSYKTASGEQKAEYFDCTAFGELGQHIAKSLSKGMRVAVLGRLQQSKWTVTVTVDGKQEEQTRSKVEVLVDEAMPSLRWATAVVTKIPKPEPTEAPTAEPAQAELAESPF